MTTAQQSDRVWSERGITRSSPRRGAAIDRRIFDSALSLLREQGPAAVTVEAVAARSGVARTTIYRRHKDRDDLLGAALNDKVVAHSLIPGADIREDLLAIMRAMSAMLEERLGVGIVVAVLADEDSERASLVRAKYIRPRREMVCDRLRIGIEEGDLGAGLDVEAGAELLLGSIVAHFATTGTYEQDWAERVLDAVWPAFAPPDQDDSCNATRV